MCLFAFCLSSLVKCLLNNLLTKNLVCLVSFDFWEFFMYSGHKSFVGHMICKYLQSLSVPCYFNTVHSFFGLLEVYIFVQTNLSVCFLSCFFFLFYFLFFFLGPHLQHIEVPRLGVESELQLLADATATATWEMSHVCDQHHNSRLCRILNTLSEARDWTLILMDPCRVCFCWATMGTPKPVIFNTHTHTQSIEWCNVVCCDSHGKTGRWKVFLRSLDSDPIASPLLGSWMRLSPPSLEVVCCIWGYLAWVAKRPDVRFVSAIT